MDAIGGYFGFELADLKEYHDQAIGLNTGRNAFEYILRSTGYNKVFIPYFTCSVILEPILKLNIQYEFYKIDENFEPLFDYNLIDENCGFLYTNYFGLKDEFTITLSKICKNLIIDNAQSFFSKPISGIDTFYSPRKFFGLPDGGYVYSNKTLMQKLSVDHSVLRFNHLLKRIDDSAEAGYADFATNDANLKNQPILQMSNITKKLLRSINYDMVSSKRIENYNYLNHKLGHLNKLKFGNCQNQVPLVYPFWCEIDNLRNKLTENKIYTATYWPNVIEWTNSDALERSFVKHIIYLPIDQRLNVIDLQRIIKLIENEY